MKMAKKLKLTRKREAWAARRTEAPTFRGDPLQHNAAVAVRYVGALSSLTAQMTAQVKREILRLYKTDAAGAHFGQDATIASQSRILMTSLADRFNDLFAKKAKPLAENMIKAADTSGAKALHSSLQKLSGGMSLKTAVGNPALTNIYKASVAENVSLIKSIAAEYLQKVEGAVMRSITTGNGLQDLIPALEQYEGQTHRRAKNIALDQTRKAYNSINRGRMEALGVGKFMWHHSGGGAHPREDHVEMDGEIFSFEELPVIDERTGERGIPGQAPNCKCTMSPVFDFLKE
jgi:SPP1 gp7 family putative phage head morphogenesis protein